MRAEAATLDQARLDAHEECLDVELALGRHAEICVELRELVDRRTRDRRHQPQGSGDRPAPAARRHFRVRRKGS